ncbi:amino acid adenylation domain-containing protein [Streptomyces eurythermus]
MTAPTPVPELVARQIALTPDRPAVAAAGRQLTYAELDARADALAHALVAHGAVPDRPVGVLLPRGPDLVVTLLAVWRAGAAYLPLDPGHPSARLSGLVEQTGLALVVTDGAGHARVTAAGATAVRADAPARGIAPPGGFARAAVEPGGAAYVMHTSGSTGRPKGVVIDHAGLANRVRWAIGALGLDASDRVLQKTPVTFDAAGWEIFAPLAVGGTVVLAPEGAERDPAALLRAVADTGASVLQVVPSVLRALAEVDGWDRCGALRVLACAGEPLHAEAVQRVLALAPSGVTVWNTYGPTECSVDITAHRFDPAQRTGPVPIGRPITGMRVLVLDDSGEPADTGELFAGGVGVARGYLGRADLTAERFVPDPYGPAGARLYRTGDRVRVRPDGALEYLGRIDRQVKISGVRIEPGEIEAALETHPAVGGAAVVPVEAPGGGTALAAYVRAPKVPDGLREYLAERLPGTHVPSVLIAVDRFPATSSGKLDRAALPAPSPAAPAARRGSAAEETVARVWRDLFKSDGIDPDADFYQLGGTSLQFTRLVNRLRKATGRDLALADLLTATTITDQARLLTGRDDDNGPTDGTAPVPPYDQTRPLTGPAPSADQPHPLTSPAPSADQTRPLTSPAPSADQTRPLTSPAPSADQTRPLTSQDHGNHPDDRTGPVPPNDQTHPLTGPAPSADQPHPLTAQDHGNHPADETGPVPPNDQPHPLTGPAPSADQTRPLTSQDHGNHPDDRTGPVPPNDQTHPLTGPAPSADQPHPLTAQDHGNHPADETGPVPPDDQPHPLTGPAPSAEQAGRPLGPGAQGAALSPAGAVAALGRPGGHGGPVPLPRTGPLPLSFGQRRLWVLDRMKPRGREWVSALFLPVPDGTGADLVAAALDRLVERHEALRTAFVVENGEPMQLIRPPVPLELSTAEVTPRDLPAVLDRELDRGFDLAGGPLARALLARDPAPGGRQVLVLSVHHIVCDGWSSSVLEREFATVLAALRAGREPELPALPVQYADFAVWQRERITPETVERELAYWRTALDGAAPLEPRPDHPRPRVRDGRGAMVPLELSPEVTAALTELGRSRGATPFMTLLTGFGTLLARRTGQWDVVLGTPVAGRDRPGTEGVVGFFLNSLVLRLGLSGGMTFDAGVQRVRDACRAAFAHQELPFEQLVAGLAPERDASRTPLYQVAFDLHDEELTGSAADAADLATLVEVSRIAKTDLTLYLRRRPDGGMSGGLEYATALFERDTVARMAEQFVLLLQRASASPGTRLDALDLLPDAERGALLRWSGTPAPAYTTDAPGLFERRADASPDAVALRTETGEVTFAELDRRANRIAHRLRDLGAGADSVVGVLVDRGADLIAALLGVWKAGAAYLPIEPGTPAERVRYMLADAGAGLLVSGTTVEGARTVSPSPEPGEASRPARCADPRRLAYVVYTSGSTGRPKGVGITHAALAGHLRWAVDELALPAPGGAAVFTSVAFDLGVPNLWAGLLAGRPTTLLPQDLELTELGDRLAAAAPLAFLKLTPGHLEILSGLPEERIAGLAARIVVAGEALPAALAERWASLLGPGRLINEYGPTETCVGATVHPVTAGSGRDSVPIGRPLPGVRAHVLDSWLRPVPVGAVGELCVGGAGVGRGYTGRPEQTAERFVPDPFGAPGDRLYRTGDLARVLDGGEVEFLGRADTQVKIRGYRVELAEIAAVVAEHPRVRQAVATAHDGLIRVAYVPDGTAPSPRSLAALCAARLPAYMQPAAFTALAAIPLNANGKVDLGALPAPAPGEGELVAPRGIVEERVAEIFSDLLAAPVGAHTGFFRAGGNSILAIRLVAALQDAFDVDLPIRAVFEGPTVAELAALIEDLVRSELDAMSDAELNAYGKEDVDGLRLDDRAAASS